MKKIICIVLAFCSFSFSLAQKAPMKFGKVDIEDLEMEYYPSDSTVEAAILCEYGKFSVATFFFAWQRRVKIFSREGTDWLMMNGPSETKNEVRGFVYNLVDGEIERDKISRDHIYIERVSENRTRVRVAPPNVREGSVVDIEFMFQGIPASWQFQQTIPVRHSELIIPVNKYFTFRYQQIGYERIESVSKSRYIARNMPAFRSEPYLNSANNYLTSLLIDLTQVHISRQNSAGIYEAIANEWSDVNSYYREDEFFGAQLRYVHLFLNEYAKSIEAKTSDKDEKIHLAVQTLHEHVSWNDIVDFYPEASLKGVWDDGVGTSADMNFILMVLLKKLDIECNPLLISRRSLGIVNPYFPTRNKFNSVIVGIPDGDSYLLIDASDKYTLPGMLPTRSTNQGGFLLSEDGGKWVDYTPDKPYTKMSSCSLKFDEYGELSGKLSIKYSDYSAISMRRSYDTYTNVDKYLEDFESENENVLVNDYKNDIEDAKHGPVTEVLDVEISGYASMMGDMITFKPVIFDGLNENPFKLEQRKYPIDFTAPRKEIRIFNYIIQEGMVIEQMPESISIKTLSNSASYRYVIQQVGNLIQLMIHYNINKPIFVQAEYEELKLFFNEIVQKEKENIILKKK